jgi:hypothetical protein
MLTALFNRARTNVHPAQTLGVRKLVSRHQIRQADFYPQARFMKARSESCATRQAPVWSLFERPSSAARGRGFARISCVAAAVSRIDARLAAQH